MQMVGFGVVEGGIIQAHSEPADYQINGMIQEAEMHFVLQHPQHSNVDIAFDGVVESADLIKGHYQTEAEGLDKAGTFELHRLQ